MKTIFKILILTLTVLTASSIAFAEDNNARGPVSDQALSDGNDSPGQRLAAEKKAAMFSSKDYDTNTSERFSLYRAIKEKDMNARGQNLDVAGNPGIDIYNVPQQLVNSITYDFSFKGKRASAGLDFIEWPSKFSDALQIGAAFLTNLAVHEFGHEVVANNVGAEDSKLNFFKKSGGNFFLGTSTVSNIDQGSILPYAMGGEFFADLTFEHALQGYRNSPNTYNRSLLLISGTDFLWYCFYAFYVSNDNPSYDPITISKETGISKDMLFSVALAKTLANAYRIYSGQDKIVPYFKVDRSSASLNFMIPLDIGS